MSPANFTTRRRAGFFRLCSFQRPTTYDSLAKTENARLAACLPYIFAISRVAHLLKIANRHSLGTQKDRHATEAHLNQLLASHTTLNPDGDAIERAERPLSYSELCVDEETDSADYHRAKLYLRFHPPLDGLTAPICTTLRLRC